MKASKSREGLRRFLRRPPLRPTAIEGYSLARILLAGLVSPALVIIFLLVGFFITELIGLTLMIKLVIVLSTAMVGFIVGVVLLIRLSNRILKFAKVKERC